MSPLPTHRTTITNNVIPASTSQHHTIVNTSEHQTIAISRSHFGSRYQFAHSGMAALWLAAYPDGALRSTHAGRARHAVPPLAHIRNRLVQLGQPEYDKRVLSRLGGGVCQKQDPGTFEHRLGMHRCTVFAMLRVSGGIHDTNSLFDTWGPEGDIYPNQPASQPQQK